MATFLEFFAGGGMVNAGLGNDWQCLFANDFCDRKVQSYVQNWGGQHIQHGDIRDVNIDNIPGQADLAWASFPCQDLSLAGSGAGLESQRSGTFWPFISVMTQLKNENRTPSVIALENVCGALTSNEGKDFFAIIKAVSDLGYKVGALTIDAKHFVPQSRPRLFIVGVKTGCYIPRELVAEGPLGAIHSKALVSSFEKLSEGLKTNWIWWNLNNLPKLDICFSDVIDENPVGVNWHTAEETRKLLALMTETNLKKVRKAQAKNKPVVGGVYKRTRNGVQRAEVRFDDLSGCLRTPSGGSSRQTVMIVNGDNIRTRLLSAREGARLMGLSESYVLPENYNTAYHLVGDGVAVPVVSFLANNLFNLVIDQNRDIRAA